MYQPTCLGAPPHCGFPTLNAPRYVPGSAMTPKDLKDLDFCLKNIDFDWVALSFVQEAADILQLRGLMGDHPGKVIAKIEKPSAITNLKAITDVCDGIMVRPFSPRSLPHEPLAVSYS